jgi:FAD binding domain-containing protein
MSGPMVPNEINVYVWRGGFHLLFPMRGSDHWRVVGIVPRDLREREDLDVDAVLPSVRNEVGPLFSFHACSWFSTYHIHHRRAERFRDRRCFLLGDAAHIHSPVGAQGMNTGLQDAYNLAWKLALVTSGRADDELLDSFELERVPIAERLLRTTDRAFSLVVSDRWLAGVVRARALAKVVGFAMGLGWVRALAFRTISQIGIRYRTSPLSETMAGLDDGAPRAGDRFPWLRLRLSATGSAEDFFTRLDDTRFNLVVIGQPVPADLPDLKARLVTHQVPDDPVNDVELRRARLPKPSFYLLRPDCHIGLAGVRLDAATLTRYVAEHLRLRS